MLHSMWLRSLSKGTLLAYTLLRVVSGLNFGVHGLQKFGLLGGHEAKLWSQMWFGAVIEVVAGLLVALGFQTRCAAFVASGTMAVAYTQFHWKLQLGEQLLPTINRGELALVYALLFLYIACRGADRLSLDRQ
jgi:putative oxidoreductase